MESIKHSIQDLTEHFNSRMAEFQKTLQSSIPASSPTTNIAAQFNTFRVFVLTALESLQKQVELLSKQYNQMEMRSRRKMLLLHGIPEEVKENVPTVVSRVLSDKLKLPEFTMDKLSRCQRLGQSTRDKPRAILVKFHDASLRNKIWYSKTSLKNTGVTLSEFLTKERHELFMAARRKFGISKCWTKDGAVIVTGSDGKRHRIVTTAELNSIKCTQNDIPLATIPAAIPSTSSVDSIGKSTSSTQAIRSKRTVKK
ncbi:uncharacterized protein LOC126778918 [Nymphalis io]|uniref:uncharacterized protein LOC126778763 n=1 Tax=Inachis io TaxID=171585 RepID=UPI002166FB70|nr:uncharacterized protein LOC126778763 [Nymphalis io]XP_050358629.1 uncharacterized protein LOC126778918 [Nymphalis io]